METAMPRGVGAGLTILFCWAILGQTQEKPVSKAAGAVPAVPCATIELLLPPGATAIVDGKELRDRRILTVDDLNPTETKRVKVSVTFSDGATDERLVDVSPGQQILVALPQPGPDKPATVATQTLTPITAAALSRNGRYIAVGLESKVIVLWDTAEGRPIRTLVGHQKAVHSVTFSPDANQLLSGSADASAILWDTTTGNQLRTFKGHTGPVLSVAFSPDGSRVLSGSADTRAILWKTETGEPVHTLKGHPKAIMAVAYSPDGSRVATASADFKTTLWDVATGKQTVILQGHKEEVSCVAFSPDGSRVGTGSWENNGIIWDSTTGKRVGGTAFKHSNDVYSIAFTPDGRRFITGDREELIMMWDTATGQMVRKFTGHSADVVSLAVSVDGRTFLSGSRDGTAKLWDLATGRELLTLTTDATRKTWAVVAPDGLFDASEAGRRAMGFRFTKLPWAELDQVFNDCYRPGLLAEVFRGHRPFNPKQRPAKSLAAMQIRVFSLIRDTFIQLLEQLGALLGGGSTTHHLMTVLSLYLIGWYRMIAVGK
jgi:WD40 repeat protein